MNLSSLNNPHQLAELIQKKPVLYSFRRCPFAIRVRLVLKKCNIPVLLREIELNDKPACMIVASPKATVPVLVLQNRILDESMDIIFWALSINDPHHMKDTWIADIEFSKFFLDGLDNVFKYHLDRYKYSSRYKTNEKFLHRDMALSWIKKLEEILKKTDYLSGDRVGIFDYVSLPFIRQFRIADPIWFDSCNVPNLQKRLFEFEESDLFKQVMQRVPIWKKTGIDVKF